MSRLTRNGTVAVFAMLVLVCDQPCHAQYHSVDSTFDVAVSRRGPTAKYAVSSVARTDVVFRTGQYVLVPAHRATNGGSLLTSAARRGIRVLEAWFEPARPLGTKAYRAAIFVVRIDLDGVPAGIYRQRRDFADLVVVDDPFALLRSERVTHFELIEAPSAWSRR